MPRSTVRAVVPFLSSNGGLADSGPLGPSPVSGTPEVGRQSGRSTGSSDYPRQGRDECGTTVDERRLTKVTQTPVTTSKQECTNLRKEKTLDVNSIPDCSLSKGSLVRERTDDRLKVRHHLRGYTDRSQLSQNILYFVKRVKVRCFGQRTKIIRTGV